MALTATSALTKPRPPSKPDTPQTTEAGPRPERRNLGTGGTFRLEPPRLRTTADPREERHATWFELFFDLVFVAAVSQLGAALARIPLRQCSHGSRPCSW